MFHLSLNVIAEIAIESYQHQTVVNHYPCLDFPWIAHGPEAKRRSFQDSTNADRRFLRLTRIVQSIAYFKTSTHAFWEDLKPGRHVGENLFLKNDLESGVRRTTRVKSFFSQMQ